MIKLTPTLTLRFYPFEKLTKAKEVRIIKMHNALFMVKRQHDDTNMRVIDILTTHQQLYNYGNVHPSNYDTVLKVSRSLNIIDKPTYNELRANFDNRRQSFMRDEFDSDLLRALVPVVAGSSNIEFEKRELLTLTKLRDRLRKRKTE